MEAPGPEKSTRKSFAMHKKNHRNRDDSGGASICGSKRDSQMNQRVISPT